MKVINLWESDCDSIDLKFKTSVKYVSLSSEYRVKKRRQSAFVYIEKGSIHYSCDNGEFTAPEGTLLYVPQWGAYKYDIKNADFVQIEVEFFCESEAVAFSKYPFLVKGADIAEVQRAFRRLDNGAGAFEKKAVTFVLLEQLYNFYTQNSSARSKITNAIEYISIHCNEKIYMDYIAKLCFLSESQMRRLFREELGMSPVEFKNSKRMEAAYELLKYSHMTIGEISNSLGFDNGYSFSTFFKKLAGVSPREYREEKRLQ